MHEGLQFKCQKCGKAFLRKRNLHGHQIDCGKILQESSGESMDEGTFHGQQLKLFLL